MIVGPPACCAPFRWGRCRSMAPPLRGRAGSLLLATVDAFGRGMLSRLALSPADVEQPAAGTSGRQHYPAAASAAVGAVQRVAPREPR